MRSHLNMDMIRRIAEGGADGRFLAINTTNLDHAASHPFDLVAEAQHAIESGELDRIHNIVLASAVIPRRISVPDDRPELHVDGGVTGNIIYGGQARRGRHAARYLADDLSRPGDSQDALLGDLQQSVPSAAAGDTTRVDCRHPTQPRDTGTRASTTTALHHLLSMAEVSRLKTNADMEVRVVSIPEDLVPPARGAFVKETMNELADLGESLDEIRKVGVTSHPCGCEQRKVGAVQPGVVAVSA